MFEQGAMSPLRTLRRIDWSLSLSVSGLKRSYFFFFPSSFVLASASLSSLGASLCPVSGTKVVFLKDSCSLCCHQHFLRSSLLWAFERSFRLDPCFSFRVEHLLPFRIGQTTKSRGRKCVTWHCLLVLVMRACPDKGRKFHHYLFLARL